MMLNQCLGSRAFVRTPSCKAQQLPTAPRLTACRALEVEAEAPVIHVVEEGETLADIAYRYGIGVQDLKDANPELFGGRREVAVGKAVSLRVSESMVAAAPPAASAMANNLWGVAQGAGIVLAAAAVGKAVMTVAGSGAASRATELLKQADGELRKATSSLEAAQKAQASLGAAAPTAALPAAAKGKATAGNQTTAPAARSTTPTTPTPSRSAPAPTPASKAAPAQATTPSATSTAVATQAQPVTTATATLAPTRPPSPLPSFQQVVDGATGMVTSLNRAFGAPSAGGPGSMGGGSSGGAAGAAGAASVAGPTVSSLSFGTPLPQKTEEKGSPAKGSQVGVLDMPMAQGWGRPSSPSPAVLSSATQQASANVAVSYAPSRVVPDGLAGSSLVTLKAGLLESVYGTARGVACTGEQRAMIEEYVAALEGRNPNARPTDSMDKLEGSWKLVYTSNTQTLMLLNAIDSLPLVDIGDVYQVIDGKSMTAHNKIDIAMPMMLSLTAEAGFEVRTPRAFKVRFTKVGVDTYVQTPQLLAALDIPDSFSVLGTSIDLTPLKRMILDPVNSSIETAQALLQRAVSPEFALEVSEAASLWMLTTYLDETLRVSRDDSGAVYVMLKDVSLYAREMEVAAQGQSPPSSPRSPR